MLLINLAWQGRTNTWPAIADWTCCRNADAEMSQMSNGKNADVELNFPGIPAFHHLHNCNCNCTIYLFKHFLPDLFFRNLVLCLLIFVWFSTFYRSRRNGAPSPNPRRLHKCALNYTCSKVKQKICFSFLFENWKWQFVTSAYLNLCKWWRFNGLYR